MLFQKARDAGIIIEVAIYFQLTLDILQGWFWIYYKSYELGDLFFLFVMCEELVLNG